MEYLIDQPRRGGAGRGTVGATPFSDLNNLQIADLMSGFLARKGLD